MTDPLRKLTAVTACLKLRDCALFLASGTVSDQSHEWSMRMGCPIIIKYRVGLKPSPSKQLPVRGSRACADVPRRRGHGRCG
jgi:hypothetical protein